MMTDTLVAIEWSKIFAGKEFTRAMFNPAIFESWQRLLAPLRDDQGEALEVGSFEGQSANALLELLPHFKLTCIDNWATPEIEARFDANLLAFGDRLVKLKGNAARHLGRLKPDTYSIVYHDCGKSREATLAQTALAWPLLKIGGIFIWDDLAWEPHRPVRPEHAIRLFVHTFGDCLTVLHEAEQMIVRKSGDWPRQFAG
jgi:predicted O-methyltransferase YrrM